MRDLKSLYLCSYVIVCMFLTGCLSRSSSGNVAFLDAPDSPVSKCPLRVQFSCFQPSVVHVQVLVTFDTGSTSVVFHKHWNCEPGRPRTRVVFVGFPDWIVYRPDRVIRGSDWALSCLLRGWIGPDETSGPDRFFGASVSIPLNIQSPLSRPLKQHQLCANWDTDLLWRFRRDTPQCAQENEAASLLSTLYASTGERYGIIKTLQPFSNPVLEGQRLKSIHYPWCAVSLWLLLVKPCSNRFCGLLHHIDAENNYASPTVFLTESGKIHVQVHGDAGRSSAFLSAFKVPLYQWCRINLEILGRMVKISIACIEGQEKFVQSAEHTFGMNIMLDDTHGYFVIGGGKFIQGVEGYYGPVTYYRTQGLSADRAEIHLPHVLSKVNITGWFQSCQNFRSELELFSSLTGRRPSDCCLDPYTELLLNHSTVNSTEQLMLFQSSADPYRRAVVQMTKQLAQKSGRLNETTVGRKLYALVLRRISRAHNTKVFTRVMPLLLQSGCLGDYRALHLSSVLYSTGFTDKRQTYKAWLLALLAAQKDWRLALMRLGHMHHVGDLEVTADRDLSYAYYINIARQTSVDQKNPSAQQTFVEVVRLNDEETLKAQTSENDDLFHWLKLQARSGVAEAEQAMGRMLFWGQQGLSPDIQTAVKHYERGAIKLNDPVSMYDYAIVLLTGQGVQKDVRKAVTFLKKAIEQGSVPALTALGWYYEQYEKDYEKAVHLWEEADAKGHADAAMNLGVFHSQGLYPGQPADPFKGYKYFLKSAQRGLLSGGIELADIWIHGLPGQVARRPSDAVLWVKWASEQNGHLGRVLRKGLNAYFRGNWMMSLIYYVMAAESGFEAAQFNVAYLCELNSVSLDPALATRCMLRYYNMSIQAQDPVPYALIRTGDLIYGENQHSEAAQMYKRAALRNEPQGWYNLGLLVQNGASLPFSVLSELHLLHLHLRDRQKLLCALFQRCRETNSTDAYLPCTLALFSAHLQSLQLHQDIAIKLLATVSAAVGTLSFLFGLFKWRTTTFQQTSASRQNQQQQEDD
ncbi:protein sel-1 homolog 3 precursor [Danio rerio]|uniref:Protein sel-1 homolog 3 precursor n=1 Tax=Danio rerio TaxID=7955 RepID=F1RBB8_DANRE|nr:protein sel-1 homolog 3 precursor [Danio rerio]|eukprot:XP_688322.5 protein sel-1 homolog 3 isoform X1 [Danio rerio]